MRQRLVGLVEATHPIPAVSVTMLVGGVAVARGATAGELAWIVASTAAGQASVGWSNDYLDRGVDAAAGREEKPIVAGRVAPRTVWLGALALGLVSPLLSLPLGLAPALVMAVGVASAWVYNAGAKGMWLSWAPYAVSFGLAPVYVWLAVDSGALPPAWIVAGAALLGVAGHLTNVVPDLDVDRDARGLPHRLGRTRAVGLAAALVGGVLVLALAGSGGFSDPTAGQVGAAAAATVLVGAVALSVARGRPRLGFHLTIAAVAAVVLSVVLSARGLDV